jgi:HK97 family phage major capsid protein
MSKVAEMTLVEKRNYLWTRMREIMDVAREEKRDLTAEQAVEFDRLETELNECGTQLRETERERERQSRYDNLLEVADRKASRDAARLVTEGRQQPTATDEYRNAFIHWMRHGRDGMTPELRKVMQTGYQADTPDEARAQTVTTTGGGYLIPEGFRAELIRAMKAFGGVRENSRVITTSGVNPLMIPTIDDTSNTGRLLTINTQVTETAMTFGTAQLDAYKYTSDLVLVPVELMEDAAFDMNGLVNSILAERLGRITETQYTTGTGTNQPNGVVTAAASGKVGTAGQTTTVTADDIMDLFHSLDPAYRGGAKFMMNDATVAAVRKLKTGVSGDNTYLWQPGLQAGAPDLLLGRPVIVNQNMAVMAASAKSILFGNFDNYWIRDVSAIRFVRMDERYADYDQVGFVVFLRTDGDRVGPSGSIKYYQNPAA